MPDLASTELAGRVALVTGASGGIGRAIGARLAELGCAVAAVYGSRAEPASELVDEIARRGGRAVAVGADLSDPAAPAQLIDVAVQALGPIDMLVANAGAGRQQPFEEITVEDWQRLMDVNLRAPFLLTQAVLPGMRERGWGRVLYTSSVAAFTGGVVGAHYAASKAGLHGLLHYVAARVAADGVTVNAIAPALITGTEMLPGPSEELEQLVPARRLGTPAEVADLATTMLANPYMTSQVVGLDGGMYPR
jgi:3-oxoacyl-[acyl-carrier protein] reductase